MAKVSEEDVEYDSDPEEGKRLLGMRRREAASDDEGEEEEDDDDDDEEDNKPRIDRRPPIHSDESDGQGGAAEYEDDDEEEEDELEDYEEEEVYEDDEEEAYEDGYVDRKGGNQRGGEVGGVEVKEMVDGRKSEEERVEGGNGEEVEGGEGEEEGKKENEPFAVPTAGAFYMHDDRFRDNAGGRHRRTYGGRKLWESKDDKKWGHDKFEELTMQERHYEQGRRTSRGHFRGRGGKNRGPDRGGHTRRNRSKAFSNGDNQNQAPKGMRGRGPRKYEPIFKNSGQAPPTQNKQPGKPLDKTFHGISGRGPTPSNKESDQVPPARKHSSLSSASPPFYPSGSSNKDITLTQKRDVQAGSTSRNINSPVIDESFSMQQTNALVRGKNIADSVGIDKLYVDDSVNPATGKSLNNVQMTPGSSLVNTVQTTQSRAQGRGGANSGQLTYQATSSHNQVNRASPATQIHPAQRNPSQGRIQPSVRSPGQQFGPRSGSRSQASSPPKTTLSINSYEPGEVETNSESNKSRNALVAKGKNSVQGSGRGSLLYSGAQVMGSTGNIGHGDQNFPGPAFLPVMQFGGQHPGGIGVPAVGMAFPGYVAQPQLGLGNSEMTWLPVLAGAAGGLGQYCSPYITVDGAYHTRPSGQTSSLGTSSKENNSSKTNNEWKPSHRPEVVSDEYGQRQKPRRYSEMDFKQLSTST